TSFSRDWSSDVCSSDLTGIENKYQSFNVSPDIGYFIQDNWVIGVSLPLSWQDSRSNANSTASHQLKTSSLGVGPFVRKYFPLVRSEERRVGTGARSVRA